MWIIKGFLKGVIALLICVAAVVVFANIVVITDGSKHIADPKDALSFEADCIIVLGASVYSDGTPSTILKDRLDAAIELYNNGAATVLLLSGDNGTVLYDEVDAMRDYALAQGVPSQAIVCDRAGFSTYESMYRAKNVFHNNRAIVVTQTYHLYRALYVGDGLDMEVCGVASDYHTYADQFWFDVREIPARTKDFFQTLFQVNVV